VVVLSLRDRGARRSCRDQEVVARHYDRLAPLYRLGFYEDLHYASEPMARDVGLQSLQRAWGPDRFNVTPGPSMAGNPPSST